MLANLIKRVNRTADFLNALFLCIIAVGVLASVFGRYLFRSPLPGLVDAAYFSMLACMFLQTGKALHEGKHIATSLVKDRLSGSVVNRLEIVVNAVILICAGILVWYSLKFTYDSVVRNWYHGGSLAMPMYLLYSTMFLGSLYMALIAVLKLIENIRKI